MTRRFFTAALLLAVVASVLAPTLEAQCAMCRTALESSEQGLRMAEKLNRGILVLLGAPFGVVLAVGLAMRRRFRR